MTSEPTTSELRRWMERLEGNIHELKEDIRRLADEVGREARTSAVAIELLRQRLDNTEQRVAGLERQLREQDGRLRVVEADLVSRQDDRDQSRRAAAWISAGISAAGLAITIVVQLLG